MRVIGIKHKVEKDNSLEVYASKFERALDKCYDESGIVDVAVGPDYALCQLSDPENCLIDFESVKNTLKRFGEISQKYKKTLMFPGTSPKLVREGVMQHFCPVFINGRKIKNVFKETNAHDSEIAKKNNLVYEGVNSDRIYFKNGDIILASICSDHGKKSIPENTFLEIIMAYDDFGGFYSKPGDFLERFGFIANGYDGSVECVHFNPFGQSEGLETEVETENFKTYTLK